MGLTWIDGARIAGADKEETTPDKEKAMAKTITSDKRLYDTDAHGIRFLAYPVGHPVPEAEYKRLTAVENKKRGPVENKAIPAAPAAPAAPATEPAADATPDATPAAPATGPAPEGKPLKRMNKEELRDYATDHGVEWAEEMTNRELMEAIEAAAAAE